MRRASCVPWSLPLPQPVRACYAVSVYVWEELALIDRFVSVSSVVLCIARRLPGLVHLVKLTQHFLDEMQLRSLLEHLRSLVRSPYTGSRLQKVLSRCLAVCVSRL
jgi:hypothetical protein